MHRIIVSSVLAAALAGCGLVDTGASAAAAGQSAEQQAAQARRDEERVRQGIDAANRTAEEQRRAAEAQAQ